MATGLGRLVATAATAVVLAYLPTAARADTSGNDLWNWCTSKGAALEGLCAGYVTAIAEVTRQTSGLYGFHACLPEGSTRQQAVDVMKRWLEQHPEDRHYNATALVGLVLARTFPCKP